MDYPRLTEKDTKHMNRVVHEILYSGRRIGYLGAGIALVENASDILNLLYSSLATALNDVRPYAEITSPTQVTAVFREDGLDKAVAVEAKQVSTIIEKKGLLRKRKLYFFEGFDMYYVVRWPGETMTPASIMWVVVRLSGCYDRERGSFTLKPDAIEEFNQLQLNVPSMNAWIRKDNCNWVMACVRMRGQADIVFDERDAQRKGYRVRWKSEADEEKVLVPCAPLFAPIGAKPEPSY